MDHGPVDDSMHGTASVVLHGNVRADGYQCTSSIHPHAPIATPSVRRVPSSHVLLHCTIRYILCTVYITVCMYTRRPPSYGAVAHLLLTCLPYLPQSSPVQPAYSSSALPPLTSPPPVPSSRSRQPSTRPSSPPNLHRCGVVRTLLPLSASLPCPSLSNLSLGSFPRRQVLSHM